MTRDDVTKRFNALPKEHRVTIIGNELEQEIRWIEREKRARQAVYKDEMRIFNGRIKDLERYLEHLTD